MFLTSHIVELLKWQADMQELSVGRRMALCGMAEENRFLQLLGQNGK